MESSEEDALLSRTREWFEDPEQVTLYAHQSADGLTPLETELLSHLSDRPRTILDLGCGAGRLSIALALRGHRVIGTDVSTPLIEAARASAAHAGADAATFALTVGVDLPAPDHSFDLVLSVKHYCYIPGRDLRQELLRRIARALHPDGRLLLISHVVPSPDDAAAELSADPAHRAAARDFPGLEPLDTFADGRGYVHWFTRESLRDELDAFGEIEHVVESPDGFLIGLILRPTMPRRR
ncbi:class I SAM-dependent methyltransferase [Microbacterium gorillae]|uniref:class I SAM-dependent methyltransferase n=1 Tax=Microbacterium gorillae TaxID=1231063 RepID=UPI000694DEFD|nr:class I SAM-dependent methyltransferase [Microbacterium gorillae]